MDKNKIVLGLILLFSLSMLVTPVQAQEYKEETGTVTTYSWPEGLYERNADTQTYISNPSKVFTWTAPKDGWGYFFVEDPDYTEGAWLPNWGVQGESEFRSGNFNVEQGEVLEIELWPRIYDEGDYINDNVEMIQWWKYHAQGGTVKYLLGYTETVESTVDAGFTYSPSKPTPGQQITVTSISTVENAEIASIYWWLNGNYQDAYENAESWTFTPSQPGNFQIEIEVTDSTGKKDSAIDTVSVKEESGYTVLDTAFTTSIQNNQPVNRKTSFEYGDEVYFWMKLGNVKGSHRVYVEWETPRPNEIIGNEYIDIPSPSTEGKTEYSEYYIISSIKPGDNSYDLLFRDPGYWKTKVLVDSDPYEYSFQIEGSLKHEATLSKTKYTPREILDVEASLTFNGAPIQGASVIPEIYRNGQLFEVLPEITVAGNGGYTLGEVLPVLPLDSPPSGPENWSIKLTPVVDAQYGEDVQELSFQVLPIWVTVEDVKLVQIVEVPEISDGFFTLPHVAANRVAGARIYLKWHGYEDGFTAPELDVQFTWDQTEGSSSSSGYSPVFDGGEGYVDALYTLSEGIYKISVEVDRDNFYLPTNLKQSRIDEVTWEDTIEAKGMKTLDLEFIPIELNINPSNPAEVEAYLRFVKGQEDFIRDVYPLPMENIKVTVKRNVWNVPDWLEAKAGVLSRISDGYYKYIKKVRIMGIINTGNLFSNTKTIGVLPRTIDWWAGGKDGFATARMFKRVVMVKDRTSEGVSAHEIGHTLGLYNGVGDEQYDIYKPNGKEVESLILKDGKIYDLTIPTPETRAGTRDPVDRELAFNTEVKHVYCFMGNNIFSTWVTDETYLELFKALMDPYERCVLIQGIIVEGEEYIDLPWYVGEAEPDFLPYGDYTVNCLSNAHEILYTGQFGNEDPLVGFSLVIPYPVGTAEIQIVKDGTVLFSKTPSQNAPVIDQISVGTPQNNQLPVSYTVSDVDGDEVTFILFYSVDGESWSPAYPETNETSIVIDTSELQGGYGCQLKLVASDGFKTVEKTSTTFTIENKTPLIAILEPRDNITYYADTQISFSGACYDVEDGSLADLVWSSSIDGQLGGGEYIETSLSAGTHELTLRASDSNGAQALIKKTITVTEKPSVTLLSHTISNYLPSEGSQIETTNTFTTDDTIISQVTVTQATPGDTIQWTFQAPGGTSEYTYIVETEGDATSYAQLDLTTYNTEDIVGDWSITININGETRDTQTFTVTEPLTGYKWWGPLLGATILLALAAGGITLLRRRKKPETTTQPETPITQQQYCTECGAETTWIPQYSRWYCYNCKKYQE